MVERAREVCGSLRVGRGKPKSVWWNDQMKAAVKRKEDAWKGVFGTRDKGARESVWKPTKRKRERLKGAFIKVRRSTKSSLEGK